MFVLERGCLHDAQLTLPQRCTHNVVVICDFRLLTDLMRDHQVWCLSPTIGPYRDTQGNPRKYCSQSSPLLKVIFFVFDFKLHFNTMD
jgi:hypothetical protein